VSRYKVSKWTGCYPGIVILLTVMARSGFVSYPTPVFKTEAKSKNHDKLINYTVRVNNSTIFKVRVQIVIGVTFKVPLDRRELSRPDGTGRMISPGKRPKTKLSCRFIINDVNNSTALQMVCPPVIAILSKIICKASGLA